MLKYSIADYLLNNVSISCRIYFLERCAINNYDVLDIPTWRAFGNWNVQHQCPAGLSIKRILS